LLGFFTSSIKNRELLTKVHKSETIETKDTRVDETDGLITISAGLVEFDQLLSIIKVGEDNDIEVGKEVSGNFAIVNLNINIRVQYFELSDGSLSSGNLANVLFLAVEVGTEISDFNWGVVLEDDSLGTGKDEVLGSFNTELNSEKGKKGGKI
jgi:hypothetical protein